MSAGRATTRRLPLAERLLAVRRGAPALRRPSPRRLAALVASLVLLVAGWFWLRDSSLVAVRTVEVTGLGPGTQSTAVRDALAQAARSMTTLHVREDALDAAVAPYSVVKRLEVSTGFPHTLRIHVVTNVAVAAVEVGGRRIGVTADGTLLRDVTPPAALPTIPLRSAPGGTRITERTALSAVEGLGAAPEALRTRVSSVAITPAHGLELQLSHGPVLWLGDGSRLGAKWAAAAAVLADPAAAGADAIDVTAPEHPAVSGLPGGATATGESDIPTLPAGTSTTATGTATTPAATGAATPATTTATPPTSPNG